jgi:hypothetical protein
VTATGTSTVAINQMQIWLDGKKVGEQVGGAIDFVVNTYMDNSAILPGVHNLEVIELDNNYQKINSGNSGTFNITIIGVGILPPPNPAPNSVTVTAPLANSSVTLPFRLMASGTATVAINQMQIWMDGKKVGEQVGATIDFNVNAYMDNTPILPGLHAIEVIELDNAYQKINSGNLGTFNVTVVGGPVPVPPPVPVPVPVANSITVTSPLQLGITNSIIVNAFGHATVPINQLQIWLDGIKVGNYPGNSIINVQIKNYLNGALIKPGTHMVEVIELDNTYKKINTGNTGNVTFVLQ